MSRPPNDPVGFWEERYRRGSTPWDRGGVSPALLQWLDAGDIAPGRILVPGCGRGYEVLELARRAFEVVALDFAPSAVLHLVSELETAGLAAKVVEADALEWIADLPFDSIYEQTCLCSLPPNRWETYEAQLHRWLRPGGKLYALFMQTNREGGPPYHCGLEAMTKLLPASRWTWSDAPFCEVPHPAGIYELSTMLERVA